MAGNTVASTLERTVLINSHTCTFWGGYSGLDSVVSLGLFEHQQDLSKNATLWPLAVVLSNRTMLVKAIRLVTDWQPH